MAKIKFGMMMTDARGKLGGQVFSKNRSGAYVRTKVTPVNPQTSFQQLNRSLLGTLSSMWSALTELQRNAWNSAVEGWQKTNVFGDLQKPTGKNLFTGLNKIASQYFPENETMLLPPNKVEFGILIATSSSFVASTGVFAINVDTGGRESVNVRVRATGVVSQGTNYVKNLLRDVSGVQVASSESGLVITVPYRNRFGSVLAGSKVFVEIAEIAENGQVGIPSLISVIAT